MLSMQIMHVMVTCTTLTMAKHQQRSMIIHQEQQLQRTCSRLFFKHTLIIINTHWLHAKKLTVNKNKIQILKLHTSKLQNLHKFKFYLMLCKLCKCKTCLWLVLCLRWTHYIIPKEIMWHRVHYYESILLAHCTYNDNFRIRHLVSCSYILA